MPQEPMHTTSYPIKIGDPVLNKQYLSCWSRGPVRQENTIISRRLGPVDERGINPFWFEHFVIRRTVGIEHLIGWYFPNPALSIIPNRDEYKASSLGLI